LTTLPYDGNIGSIELEVNAMITWNRKILGGKLEKVGKTILSE
jgi:hypothetical protein